RSGFQSRRRRRLSPRNVRPAIEALERIIVLSTSWTGAGDGTSWSDPKNWSTGKEPGQNDDVVIDVPGNITVVYQGRQPTVKSIENHDTIWVKGSNAGGDAILTASQGITNFGTMHLESADGTWRSDINTGSSTLTNLGTISSALGKGGERMIVGTTDNRATI